MLEKKNLSVRFQGNTAEVEIMRKELTARFTDRGEPEAGSLQVEARSVEHRLPKIFFQLFIDLFIALARPNLISNQLQRKYKSSLMAAA